MHIAHIAPTSLLDTLCSTSKVQMCLAHRVLSDAKYAAFYAAASEAGQTVIMDNSLWELGEAMSAAKLFEACKLVKPAELISPDVFRDGPATLKKYKDFMFLATAAGMVGRPNREEWTWQRNLVVVHGKDRQEWLETYDSLLKDPHAHVLGLPKVLDEIWAPGGRIGCIEFLEATDRVNLSKQYHCLGIWDDPVEAMLLGKHSWIRSLDTALAIHAGIQSVRFDTTFGLSRKRPKRPHAYFGISYEKLEPHMLEIKHNIMILEDWANGTS